MSLCGYIILNIQRHKKIILKQPRKSYETYGVNLLKQFYQPYLRRLTMQFPVKENDVISLAEQMIAGFTAHAGDFPSVLPAVVTQLTGELEGFREAKTEQEGTKGQLKIATVTKDDGLENLATLMKNCLKKAEIDCTTLPENLAEIGWGPRQEPTPIVAPGTPTNLRSIAEGTGEIWLGWDKPPSESGGLVRNYLVERCEKGADGNFGPWTLVQTTYNNEAHVTEQPSNARLIYRVKAANAGGESAPSNTILVVLP
jgi:hypothetical protein